METNKEYYLYRHIRLDTNEVFYIGIGTKLNKYSQITEYYRAYSKHYRNNYWYNIVNKTEYVVEILLETSDHSFVQHKEIEFISLYGRKNLKKGTLVNLNDGGGSNSNRVVSEETRKRHSLAQKGIKKISQEHKDILSKLYKGIKPCKLAQENRLKARLTPISQFTLEGIWIRDFSSLKEATIIMKLNSHSGLSAALTNRSKSCNGFKWEYKKKN